MTPEELVDRLGLAPHPEGGAFKEVYRATARVGDRAVATSIYFLLREGQRSAWHRVAQDELWCYHGGDPLVLRRVDAAGGFHQERLGLAADALPQRLVPGGEWQSAYSTGWTLVGCVVAPGFEFRDFELATVGQLSVVYPELASLLEFPL